ncbi:Nucleolar protein 9 [Terramyces sp. JEL0728]|nr:Nucleolar protein 9 [Terramyces sp. JEL0728]
MEVEYKKRKRGKRGGKDKKQELEAELQNVQEQVQSEIQDEQEQPRKKTRRSKKGKTAIEPELEPAKDIDWVIDSHGDLEPEQQELLDLETRQYFQNIENLLETQEFESPQDQYLFISNALNEVQGKESQLATDFEGSRILEKLLKSSSDYQIRIFFSRLCGNFQTLFEHQFASHVCQTLLNLSADVIERENDEEEEVDPDLPTIEKLVLGITDEIAHRWNEYMTHSYASFLVRTLLNVLSGESLVEEGQIRSKKSANYNKNHNNFMVSKKNRLVPKSFSDKLRKVVGDVCEGLKHCDIRTLASHPVANPVLQLLVAIPESGEELVKTLLHGGEDPNEFVKILIQDRVGSHLMEKIIKHSSSPQFRYLYKTFFQPRLLQLCQHPVANFVVQKKFQQKIFVHLPNVQGALMLQHLLNFKPEISKTIVDSILLCPPTTLNLWISDPTASRILEAVLSSETAPNKSKRQLIKVFEKSFVRLAQDKYGSHFVDKCWAASNIELKELIAQELADKYTVLSTNFHAKFILRNCNVELFKKRKDEWLEHQKKEKKERKEKKKSDEIDDLFAKKNK